MPELGGYFRVWRRILDWEWIGDHDMLRLFIFLLALASYRETEWDGVEIHPGQLVTSLPTLSERAGMGVQTVRTCLRKLRETGEITEVVTNRYRMITITNWSAYQKPSENTESFDDQTNRQTNRPKAVLLTGKLTGKKNPETPSPEPSSDLDLSELTGKLTCQTGNCQQANQQHRKNIEETREIKREKQVKREKKEKIWVEPFLGEFENVRVTEVELEKLKQRFPRDWQGRIERLSGYIASKGAKYASHYATILNWARMRNDEDGAGSSQQSLPFLE